ncbi:Minor histocompatibility antigen H13 [Eumeta japonica]|uniref:Minor histocompatibility antigen H13 n=1 Tax=Eumeta variegata TaxID=151549 RepID=A0A4C1WHF8_EUMVA|nr:Minor histocompatibility antigen H13 [Eumeta japonica]
MAESVTEIPIKIDENIVDSVQNATGKLPNSIEGIALAYLSLVVMAILPIFFGSFRSVKYLKEQKESGERPETMSNKDALMFPLIASCALFGLYIFFQIFSKEYINLLLTGYFFFLGVLALSHLLSPIVSVMMPASIPNMPYHIHFTRGERDSRTDLVNYKFTSYDVLCLLISLMLGAWYLLKKHWIANNLFGIAFAINGVELLHLNNVVTGCILLCGLFLYDIFWVFGTNVMVTVAKSFEAPIKLVFPQDILVNGLSASNFAMLGLGDIVVPGIFIALLLRFDKSLQRGSELYFRATFMAYVVGLLATILVMHMFRHAQPALLYLVPACLATPLSLALLKGDINALFSYEDHPVQAPAPAGKPKKTEEAWPCNFTFICVGSFVHGSSATLFPGRRYGTEGLLLPHARASLMRWRRRRRRGSSTPCYGCCYGCELMARTRASSREEHCPHGSR